MTEDDTFRVLCRTPVPEMLGHYSDWLAGGSGQFDDLQDMLVKHGWTWKEFSVTAATWLETNV